jgi:hypothetical protein
MPQSSPRRRGRPGAALERGDDPAGPDDPDPQSVAKRFARAAGGDTGDIGLALGIGGWFQEPSIAEIVTLAIAAIAKKTFDPDECERYRTVGFNDFESST